MPLFRLVFGALLAAFAAVVLPLAAGCGDAHARLVVMVGFADYTSLTLWVQADRAGPVEIEVAPEAAGSAGAGAQRLTLAAEAATDYVVTARPGGLAPGTAYRWRIAAQGETREGTARTQAYWSSAKDAADVTIAIGSCHYLANPNPVFRGGGGDWQVFDAIAGKRPDLMLWLGDNLYLQAPDFLDPGAMAARYRQVRAFEPMQTLLTATAHLAILDDHDFGPNDADGSYVLKGQSLQLFQRFWPNPGYGLPGAPGAFGWARVGDIEFFLLDDRTYRDPNRYPDIPGKTMFGTAQFDWLKRALLASHARIKLVAAGGQFWNRASRYEGLHRFPHEQKQLADWLAEQKIDGVIFLSGDRHFGELLKVERPGAYPLYEFTSSPLTSTPATRLDAAERDNPDLVPGTLHARRQFGLIRVGGPGTDRRIALEAYDSDGAPLWRHEIRANDLRHAREKK